MRDLNVHVISLVRDPRGIVNSAGAFKAWSKFFSPRDTCNWLRNDLETYHDLTTLDHTTLDHTTLDHETRRRILQVRSVQLWGFIAKLVGKMKLVGESGTMQ